MADLGDLPENQRAALLLTELEDLSHAEAAAVLDCEPNQVKGLVFRARESLIERRDARSAPCEEIRAELSTARRGALRRGRLRHHLAQCEGCTAYLEEVRRQRRMMALILPVIPATGLKRSVLAAAGIGGGAGGAGGLTVAGGSALTGTVAKIAAVTVLAGGAGVATKEVVDRDRAAPGAAAPAQPAAAPPAAAPAAVGAPAAAPRAQQKRRAAEAKRGRSAATPGGTRSRSQGKSRSNRGATPPGQIRKQPAGQGRGVPARPVVPPVSSGSSRRRRRAPSRSHRGPPPRPCPRPGR